MSNKLLPLKRSSDGWRGIINENFSIPSVIKLIDSIVSVLRDSYVGNKVLLTHDGRFYSKEVAENIALHLVGLGLEVIFVEHLATPIASLQLTKPAYIGAILVTASHNPFYWNGIKLKVPPGMPPPKRLEDKIDSQYQQVHFSPVIPKNGGKMIPINETILVEEALDGIFLTFKNEVIETIRAKRLRVASDALNGISGSLFKVLFERLNCRLTSIGEQVDPLFGNHLPDPTYAPSREKLSNLMQALDHDVGFITDGDGDRLCVLDEKGEYLWPHDVLALLIEQFQHVIHDYKYKGIAVSAPTGAIVARVANKQSTSPIHITEVGFKNIAPYLHQNLVDIGGGCVGEFGCSYFGYDRNPIIGIIMVLYVMSVTQQTVSKIMEEYLNEYGRTHYKQWTFSRSLSNEEISDLVQTLTLDIFNGVTPTVTQDISGPKVIIDPMNWFYIRNATTENGLRVYAETQDEDALTAIYKKLKEKLQVDGIEKS